MSGKAIETWSLDFMSQPDAYVQVTAHPETLTGLVDMQFSDGTIRVSKRWAAMNLFWFPMVTTFGIPLRKDHFIKYQPMNKGRLTDQLNKYYDEIMTDSHNGKRLKNEAFKVQGRLYNFCYKELLSYAPTLDIIDMAEVLHDKPMKAIIDTRNEIQIDWSTKHIEQFVDEHNKQIMNLLGTKGALKNQCLLNYQLIGQLNKFQVPQTLYVFSVRTDINDNIISYPVLSSATDGENNIYEFAVESLSAKKAQVYNKTSVSTSQYLGRRIHLVASSIRQIYNGDCGSTVTMPFAVTKDNAENVIGMYIRENGQNVLLCHGNIDQYIGKTVNLRSALTCRYTNGVCETCMGAVGRNISRRMNLGILSAIQFIEQVTQKILSSKHLIRTNSIMYELTPLASKVLIMLNASEISWNVKYIQALAKTHGLMGFSTEDFPKFDDTQNLNATKAVEVKQYSHIRNLYIKASPDAEIETIPMESNMVPSVHFDMLIYIRNHHDEIQIRDGIYWIPVEGLEHMPIFTAPVENDNIIKFVSDVDSFFKSKIAKYGTLEDCVAAIRTLLNGKASVYMAHLAVILKAYMIAGKDDYRRVPVTDPKHVYFASEASVLNHGGIGAKLAYEKLENYLISPETYLEPKPAHPFDKFVGRTN